MAAASAPSSAATPSSARKTEADGPAARDHGNLSGRGVTPAGRLGLRRPVVPSGPSAPTRSAWHSGALRNARRARAGPEPSRCGMGRKWVRTSPLASAERDARRPLPVRRRDRERERIAPPRAQRRASGTAMARRRGHPASATDIAFTDPHEPARTATVSIRHKLLLDPGGARRSPERCEWHPAAAGRARSRRSRQTIPTTTTAHRAYTPRCVVVDYRIRLGRRSPAPIRPGPAPSCTSATFAE